MNLNLVIRENVLASIKINKTSVRSNILPWFKMFNYNLFVRNYKSRSSGKLFLTNSSASDYIKLTPPQMVRQIKSG